MVVIKILSLNTRNINWVSKITDYGHKHWKEEAQEIPQTKEMSEKFYKLRQND